MKAFVDTNILVYAYDSAAGLKHQQASQLIESLWESGNGLISTQVLQEFYVNVRRKAKRPMSAKAAGALIADYLCWKPVINDGESIQQAIDLEQRYQLSFWDALIVVAAQTGGASVLYSEDFNSGQNFDGVSIENPFAAG